RAQRRRLFDHQATLVMLRRAHATVNVGRLLDAVESIIEILGLLTLWIDGQRQTIVGVVDHRGDKRPRGSDAVGIGPGEALLRAVAVAVVARIARDPR